LGIVWVKKKKRGGKNKVWLRGPYGNGYRKAETQYGGGGAGVLFVKNSKEKKVLHPKGGGFGEK